MEKGKWNKSKILLDILPKVALSAVIWLCVGLFLVVVGKGLDLGKKEELILLQEQGDAQSLGALIQTNQGNLIVVDGGWESDGEYLAGRIQEYGGRVSAWLLTHPHSDHVGALLHILQNKKDEIQIDHIYYSFAGPSWYQTSAPEDPGMAGSLLDEFKKLPEGVADGSIRGGTRIQADNITIDVLNDRYEMKEDPVNNSTVVYRVNVNGKRILFLGDMGEAGGRKLLEEKGAKELKADIVQMAHHGQNGVGKEVYQAIAPDICLWPTPEWLWNNDSGQGPGSGPWKTWETRRWMRELGVKQNLCTKDGEIRLNLKMQPDLLLLMCHFPAGIRLLT